VSFLRHAADSCLNQPVTGGYADGG
jgi:hypothetical protein